MLKLILFSVESYKCRCIPRGYLHGHLLFNLYVNDLNYFVSNESLRLYADDTTEYASDPSPNSLAACY